MNGSRPFDLHPRLAADCILLGRFSLCRVLLMNESRYPWLILVPERAGITEISELVDEDQRQLIRESSLLSVYLAKVFDADKMNIAVIGNLVPQLHIHHIVRYRDDAAWPAPVWGRFDPAPYAGEAIEAVRRKMALESLPGFHAAGGY
jgi:diadenosine tetraphosphate (Ap4A) HIT family hydrolase